MNPVKYDVVHSPFSSLNSPLLYPIHKTKGSESEGCSRLQGSHFELCTTPCSRILQVKGEAILVSQYSLLLRNWISGSNIFETAFPIKVIHSIYFLKYCIKFPCLGKHTLTQTTQCIMEFYSLSIIISTVIYAFLVLFIQFGSKYSNKFTFSENFIAECRVGAHVDEGREQKNSPEMEIHL